LIKMKKTRLIIIADDLTGAMDSSGYLAGHGLEVIVDLNQKFETRTDVIAITTNSREDPPSLATQKIKDVASKLKGNLIFKKIDSTFRGNVGPEITALAEVLSCQKVIVAPAFPQMGRTIKNGKLKIDNVPDPHGEAISSLPTIPQENNILSLLSQKTGLQAGLIPIADIEAGPEYLQNIIVEKREKILLCDSLTQNHLQTVLKAVLGFNDSWLLCGSGGLAREMFILFTNIKSSEPDKIFFRKPALMVVGSLHPASARQLIKAQSEAGVKLLKLKTEDLTHSRTEAIISLVNESKFQLKQGFSVAVTSTFSQVLPGLESEINVALAEITREILAKNDVGGIFLSGGDTAMAVCDMLKIPVIRVAGEIEPGIPFGKPAGWRSDLRVVTKSGAFGKENSIIKSLYFLEKGIL
jgi:D-threonate/D-erythronate kinase